METNALHTLSEAMANAVEKAAGYTLLVSGRERMPASGISFAADFVLTANHAVERDEDIKILLPDGQEITGQVAGRDPGSDLAVVSINQPGLILAVPATPPARIGQLALAVGRPTTEGVQASLGIISAIASAGRGGRSRLPGNFIRTDAIPYPGFSGGPLIDTAGEVLGMNTSGLARSTSLAIPAEIAWQIGQTLIKHGGIKRGYLGLRSQLVELSPTIQQTLGRNQESGLLVIGVEAGSPAENGGILVGDILVGINNQAVSDHEELVSQLVGDLVGKSTSVEILRGGQKTIVQVTLGELVVEEQHPRRGWRRHR
jgi:S1-C subfamily serine protease